MDEKAKTPLFFKPGHRENAFYTEQKLRFTSRYGLQSELNEGHFIYELGDDGKHHRVWVENK